MHQNKNLANCIKINKLKKLNNYLINKNYKAQQLDFSINTHSMNEPINLEKKTKKESNKGSQRRHFLNLGKVTNIASL